MSITQEQKDQAIVAYRALKKIYCKSTYDKLPMIYMCGLEKGHEGVHFDRELGPSDIGRLTWYIYWDDKETFVRE